MSRNRPRVLKASSRLKPTGDAKVDAVRGAQLSVLKELGGSSCPKHTRDAASEAVYQAGLVGLKEQLEVADAIRDIRIHRK